MLRDSAYLAIKYHSMDIYIGSIPFKWKDKNLYEIFEPFGEVISASIVIDKITRQNKGFGFVSMANDTEAQQAIASLNGTEYEGRAIVVNPSLPKGEIRKPQRQRPEGKISKKPMEFKSDKHKKSLPPWLRKEY
jgi:RNA recognition motif-containing protein